MDMDMDMDIDREDMGIFTNMAMDACMLLVSRASSFYKDRFYYCFIH